MGAKIGLNMMKIKPIFSVICHFVTTGVLRPHNLYINRRSGGEVTSFNHHLLEIGPNIPEKCHIYSFIDKEVTY